MAEILSDTYTQTLAIGGDTDGDGVADVGETLTTEVIVSNTGSTDAANVVVALTENGMTVDPGSIQIGPVANNDGFSITGNTPVILTKAQLIGNDSDSDGNAANLTITGFSNLNHVTVVDNGNETYTVTPETGYVGAASFSYSVMDEQGVTSVASTPGNVSLTITGLVWYVDNAYAGQNGASDGSYAKPFTSLARLNDDGTAAAPGGADGVKGDDDVDGANDTVFVYNHGISYTSGITLESGQKLYGDGHALVVNGITISDGSDGNSVIQVASGSAVTLGSGNTIDALTLAGSGTAVGLSGTNFGTATLSNVNVSASGQAISLNSGALAGTGFGQVNSQGGTNNISLTDVTGSINLGTGSLTGASGASFNVVNTTASAMNLSVQYSGNITQGTNAALVNVDGGTAGHTGTILLSGGLTATNGTGLNFENADGNYSFFGTTSLSGGNAGIDIVSNTSGNAAQGSGGTFDFFGAFSITSPTGTAITISDGTATVNADIDVTQANNASALAVTNHSIGQLSFASSGSFNVSNGNGLQFTNADGIYLMSSANTLGGTDGEVDIFAGTDATSGSSGIFTFGSNTSINNSGAGAGLNLLGSDATVTFAGSITDNNGNAVSIDDHDSGAITFSGTISASGATASGIDVLNSNGGTVNFNGQTTLSTATNAAVTLSSNAGGTINFNAGGNGLDITTTSGGGFVASGGGSVTVAAGGGNSISSTTGIALNVQNTEIGQTGLTFVSISSNGANNGIVLNGTGIASTNGGLTVTGDATSAVNASGGTIANSVGVGIALISVRSVSIDQMTVSGGGNDGIGAQFIMNGLSVTNSSILNNGNADEEDGMDLENVLGSLAVTNTIVRGSYEHNFELNNNTGTLNTLNISNSTFDQLALQASPAGGAGVQINFSTSAILTNGSISGSTFRNNSLAGVEVNVLNSARIGANDPTSASSAGIVVSGNTFDDNYYGVLGSVQNTADLTIDVQNNTISNDGRTATSGTTGTGTAIWLSSSATAGSGSTLNARIDNNIIGNSAIGGSGSSTADGIRVAVGGLTDATLLISNNTVRQAPVGYGIIASFTGPSDDIGTVPVSDITVLSNTVNHQNYTFLPGVSDMPLPSIYIVGGNSGGAAGAPTVRADVRSNSVPTSLPPGGVIASSTNNWLELRETTGTSAGNLQLLDTGAANATAEQQLDDNNTGLAGATSGVSLITGIINLPPDLAVLPMLAAPEIADAPTAEELPAATPLGGEAAEASGAQGVADTPLGSPLTVAVDSAAEDLGAIRPEVLAELVTAAIARWADAGATEAQLALMRSTSVALSDMSGVYLGTSEAGRIVLDSDGAGHGWFVDSTPGEDGEFTGSGTLRNAAEGGAAAGHMDLLTVILHELGHQAGLEDIYLASEADEIMYGYANLGERRLPAADDLAAASGNLIDHQAFALATVSVGSLPAGRAVRVIFNSTVNGGYDSQLIPSFTNSSSVTSTATTTPVSSNSVALVVDSLAIASTVFRDLDKDGAFEAGESGINGVSVSLFADANNDNVADGAAIATTVTSGNGNYTFAGLSQGNYIVSVDATNFGAAAVLNGMLSTTGSADPDDNVDNDDNGTAAAGGAVVARAVTLNYNSEPSGDINNTVDFGFVTYVAPAGGDRTVTIAEDGSHVFAAPQFNFSDGDGDAFGGVVLTTLPANGQLLLNGVAISAAGMFVSATDINSGLLTYAPAANGNGTGYASFTFQVRDNSGVTNFDTDASANTFTFDVTAANDPVGTVAPGAITLVEDTVDFAVTGMSVTDVDSTLSPAGIYEITLSSTHGTMKLTTVTGLTFTVGDGVSDASMTFHGTLADINVALATALYTPTADYFGAAQIQLQATDNFGGIVATGSGSATNDANLINVTVTKANTTPVAQPDAFTITEVSAISNGDLFADNGSGPDLDDDPLLISAVEGDAANVGNQIMLASGALLTVNADGSFNFDPNGAFQYIPAAGSGVANTSGTEQFSYTLSGGNTVFAVITITGVDNDDQLTGTAGNDTLLGGIGSDILFGLDGNDILNGGAGADWLYGGAGDDRFVVNSQSDQVFETSGNGNDFVTSSVSYVLQATVSVERLGTTNGDGTSAINLTGNLIANEIYGNAGNNVIDGGAGADYMLGFAGNDIYVVDNAADVVRETLNNGTDTIRTSVSYTLTASSHVEILETSDVAGTAAIDLTGNEFANSLIGNAGNNRLNGGAGADTMTGGAGNDRFVVDNAGDVIVEGAGQGDDFVLSSVSYTLTVGARVEMLGTTNEAGTSAINLTGNEQSNDIFGNAGANALDGGSGADRLWGRAGADTLTGGSGNDVFAYSAASESDAILSDWITDFASGDRIDLRGIDANSSTGANDAFTFIGSGAFTDSAGQLRAANIGGGNWIVEGDVDGNGTADLHILVTAMSLSSGDFFF